MIYILSWTLKKKKNSFQATTLKVEEYSRTFQGLPQKFKNFSTVREPCVTWPQEHKNVSPRPTYRRYENRNFL